MNDEVFFEILLQILHTLTKLELYICLHFQVIKIKIIFKTVNIRASIPHLRESVCQLPIHVGLGSCPNEGQNVNATGLEEKSLHNLEMTSVKREGGP